MEREPAAASIGSSPELSSSRKRGSRSSIRDFEDGFADSRFRGNDGGTFRLSKEKVLPLIEAALKEDVGSRDLTTTALIPRGQIAKAELVVQREGVIAGLAVAEWVFGQVEPKVRFQPTVQDGQKVFPGKAVAFLEGPARGILTGERVALNFLSRLSGIATLTRMFVEKVKGSRAQILDTRKTTPGLRLLERYAVIAGGGVNHRMNLTAAVLIKENHLRLLPRAGGIGDSPRRGHSASQGVPPGTVPYLSVIEQAVAQAREKAQGGTPVGVEVTSLQEFRQGLSAQPDLILLDNMRLADIQEAVRLRNALARTRGEKGPLLEVSGGVNLETARTIALTGVDRISIGALTHSAPALDISLEVVG